MGDRKRKFTHEAELDREATLALLEDLLAGLRSGQLHLEHGDQVLSLRPGGLIDVDLRARHKPGRESLTLALTWAPTPVEPVLRIRAGRPDPEGDAAQVEESRSERDAPEQADQSEREGEVPVSETASETAPPATKTLELDEQSLAAFPRARLYELAQAVELEGRSQLSKRALARALSALDLGSHLRAEELAGL